MAAGGAVVAAMGTWQQLRLWLLLATATALAAPGCCCGCGHSNACGCDCCYFLVAFATDVTVAVATAVSVAAAAVLAVFVALAVRVAGGLGENGWVQLVAPRLLQRSPGLRKRFSASRVGSCISVVNSNAAQEGLSSPPLVFSYCLFGVN